ncbi:zinc ribbon domain-containing protein [Planctomycetota bacterium]|nr:zinc ribbon domain-containing protein [Planctomycetota bacterium]
MYDLNIPDDEREDVVNQPKKLKVPSKGGKCPACNQAIKEGAAICVKCGFSLHRGEHVQTSVKKPTTSGSVMGKSFEEKSRRAALAQGYDTTKGRAGDAKARDYAEQSLKWSEYIFPTIVMAISFAIVFLTDILSFNVGDLAWGVLAYLILWVVEFVCLTIALLVMNKIMGTMVGALSTMSLKLGALSIGMIAANIVYVMTLGQLPMMCMAPFVYMAAMLVVFYILTNLFFEMEGVEPFVYFLLGYFAPVAIMFVAMMFM